MVNPRPTAMTSDSVTRRSVLRAAAWTMPVIVAAAATPAAAASLPVREVAVVYPDRLDVASYSPGTVQINAAAIIYDYARWGLSGEEEASGPDTATVSYLVEAVRVDVGTVVASAEGGPVVIAKYQEGSVTQRVFSDVPPGDYVIRVTVTNVDLSASTLPYDFRATVPQVIESAIVTVL